MDPAAVADRAGELIGLFYDDALDFGRLQPVDACDLPPLARRLLDHGSHMTVVMESFTGGPVGLRVVRERDAGPGVYAREIQLFRAVNAGADGPIQHGIVRIDLSALPATVVEAIRRKDAPLGRILIESGGLREVRDVAVLEIVAGEGLAGVVGKPAGTRLHGRVASIFLDAAKPASDPRPRNRASAAIELLEIPIV